MVLQFIESLSSVMRSNSLISVSESPLTYLCQEGLMIYIKSAILKHHLEWENN